MATIAQKLVLTFFTCSCLQLRKWQTSCRLTILRWCHQTRLARTVAVSFRQFLLKTKDYATCQVTICTHARESTPKLWGVYMSVELSGGMLTSDSMALLCLTLLILFRPLNGCDVYIQGIYITSPLVTKKIMCQQSLI